MVNRKSLWCLVVVLAVFILQMAIVEKAVAQQYKFRMGHALDVKTPLHLAFAQFAQGVEKESNGRVKISIVPDSGLGSLDEMLDQLKLGALEMMSLFPIMMARSEPKFMVDELPYLWKDADTAVAAMHGDLGKIYDALAYKQGVKILGYIPTGFRQMTNSVRPIYKPEDLKGLKIRIPDSKLRIEAFKLLGVSPTPMVYAELYSALQLKTVDGQENPLSLINTSKFYEVQKYLSLTNHILSIGTIACSRPIWEKLPKDIQEILQKNARQAEVVNLELLKKEDARAVDVLKGKGMQVNQADTASFKKALKPLYVKYGPVLGPDLVSALKKYAGAEF